jgi:hypothetical protein
MQLTLFPENTCMNPAYPNETENHGENTDEALNGFIDHMIDKLQRAPFIDVGPFVVIAKDPKLRSLRQIVDDTNKAIRMRGDWDYVTYPILYALTQYYGLVGDLKFGKWCLVTIGGVPSSYEWCFNEEGADALPQCSGTEAYSLLELARMNPHKYRIGTGMLGSLTTSIEGVTKL